MATRETIWEGRHNNFDALRLVLALLVLLSHSYPLGTGSEAREPFLRITHGQMTGGAVAVDLFFIMSGFMIAASMQRARSTGQFLMRRITRIYPAYIVCALVSIAAIATLAGASLVPSVGARIADFLLQTLRLREFTYSNAFAHNPLPDVINGSTWSIQFEVWCYIGVALLGVTGMLLRRGVLAVVFAASIVCSVLFAARHWNPGGMFLGILFGPPSLWARLLPLYIAGVVFYLYREHIPHRLWLAALSFALLIAGSLLPFGMAVVFPIAGAYCVFYLAFAPWLRLHHAARFGDFSYGAYLYAFPIQQLLVQHANHNLSPFVLFVQAAPLTLLAAIASWYAVERHFLRPARRQQTIAQIL